MVAAVFGSQASRYAEVLGQHGADQVMVFADPQFDRYQADIYYHAYRKVIQATNPDVILAGHTVNMKDVAPRIASRFGYGLISDCTNVELDGHDLSFIRPIYAGKAFEKKTVYDREHVRHDTSEQLQGGTVAQGAGSRLL